MSGTIQDCDPDYERAWHHWYHASLRERIALCARAGESIFASRWVFLPDSVYELLSQKAA